MYEQSTPPLFVVIVFTIFLLLSVASIFVYFRLQIHKRRHIVDSTPKFGGNPTGRTIWTNAREYYIVPRNSKKKGQGCPICGRLAILGAANEQIKGKWTSPI